MTERDEQPQPQDLSTGERIGTYGRAIADGMGHKLQGQHESEQGARQTVPLAEVQTIISGWPEAPKTIARQLIDKYGAPNEATPTKLFWYRNGPWKRTMLTSDTVAHNFPAPHSDFLTQTIDYRVPPDKIQLIAQFDGSILVDRTTGEVSARCDAEAANYLAMNVVHELVTGKRTVDEARELTAQSTVAYMLGRSAPYSERFLFELPQGGTQDLDESMISEAALQQAAGKVKDLVTGRHAEATDRRSDADTADHS